MVVLLAPRRLFSVDHDLAVEQYAKRPCQRLLASFPFGRFYPAESRLLLRDLLQQPHHADHGVVVERDGIDVGTAPASASPLFAENKLEAASGGVSIVGIIRLGVGSGQFPDLRVRGAVVDGALALEELFKSFLRIAEGLERIPSHVLGPASVRVLEQEYHFGADDSPGFGLFG